MDMIAIDNACLPAAREDKTNRFLQRLRKYVSAMFIDLNKQNQSPFPDRVWARHSALLNAARTCQRDQSSR